MKSRNGFAVAATAALMIAAASPALAQDTGGMVQYGNLLAKPIRAIPGVGTVVLPESSIAQPGRERTHLQILIPDRPVVPPRRGAAPNLYRQLPYETPASLACVYGLVTPSNGCDPNMFFTVASGGSRAIGIVDAFDDPTALLDLDIFSNWFGLPEPNLQVVYCGSASCGVATPPPACSTQNSDACGWALEIALDVQAAHAMAPNAKIILVEAFSASFADLLHAVDKAAQLVAEAGGGQVSRSSGQEDFSGESHFDSDYVKSSVVFFASTGDHKGGANVADIEYPSTSPNLVAVGGTSIIRGSDNAFVKETAWSDGGGGLSANEVRPTYQSGVQKVGSHRGVPDMAADADPQSGMYVYCSSPSCGWAFKGLGGVWWIEGGTSLASPLLAGMTNSAGHFLASSQTQLGVVYSNLASKNYTDIYNDITSGFCHNGLNGAQVNAVPGWDVCTGVGTPRGLSGL